MTEGRRIPLVLRLSMTAGIAGAMASLPLFLDAGPHTLVAFMFVAQPLLAAAMVLFAVQVFQDLRRGRIL